MIFGSNYQKTLILEISSMQTTKSISINAEVPRTKKLELEYMIPDHILPDTGKRFMLECN